MGHAQNLKLMRKQIRNVAQEQFQNALTNESVQACVKELTEVIGNRLDEIAKNVTAQVDTIDKQTQAFRGMLMRDASLQISRELTSISVTMLAWQEVLIGKLKLEDMDAFTAEVEAKKAEVFARLEAEAKEREEAEAKAAEAKAAEEAAKTGATMGIDGAAAEAYSAPAAAEGSSEGGANE